MTRTITLLIASFLIASFSLHAQTLKMITGVKGGSYEAMGNDIKKYTRPLVKTSIKEHTELKYDDFGYVTDSIIRKDTTIRKYDVIKMRTSRGSYDNYELLVRKTYDIGFLQYDILRNEVMNELNSRFKKSEQIKLLLPVGREHIHILARKDAGINSITNLTGKSVAIGNSLQGTNYTAKIINKKLNINWRERNLGLEQSIKAFIRGRLDAIVFVGSAPVDIFTTFSKYQMENKIKLLPMPEDEKLAELYGERVEIPAEAYSWLEEPLKTYSVQTLLVSCGTFGATQEEMLDRFMNTIVSNLSNFQNDEDCHPAWKNISLKKNNEIQWEYHKVAKKYIK